MKTAVVVPVKNERRWLNRLLQSLERQLADADEIICVDAGSTDGTREILANYAKRNSRLTVHLLDGAYPGKARNLAIRHTDASIVAQIDGGNLPADNWLSEIRRPILNNEADYVMGDVAIMPIPKRIFGRVVDLGQVYGASLFRGSRLRHTGLAPPAGGASVAYRREVWERAGGFPEWLRSGEDRLFARKLMQQNVRLVFAEGAVVFWEIGPTLGKILKRHFHHQRLKFQGRSPARSSPKTILLQAGFAAVIVSSFLFQSYWEIPLACLGVVTVHQTFKSTRAYYRRTKGSDLPFPGVVLILLLVDLLGVAVKLVGSIAGLTVRFGKYQEQQAKAQEYLSP